MITWPFLYVVLQWVIRLTMLMVVTRHRRPGPAVTWLLIIFFEPVVGIALYAAFANDRLPRRRLDRHARLLRELQSVIRRFENNPNVVIPDLGPQLNMTVALAQRMGGMPILGGNDVQLITSTEETIAVLLEDIAGAKQHIHLLFYIFADDATGRRVCEALKEAAARGVKCRVLVDAVGSPKMLKRQTAPLREAGVEIYPALPVSLFRRQLARIDLRNHRKVVVIDGQIGYTGSQNIVDASYGHRDLAWHDLMARITGPVVLELQAVFMQDWYFETGRILDTAEVFPDPVLAGDIPVQALPSGPNYPIENYQRIVVDAIHEAQDHVLITTPYFVPDQSFLEAVEVAVLTGVQVELFVPRRSDQILVGAASRAYYEELLQTGVKIYFYEPGLLHAKTLCIDDRIGFFGTSNFDIRSFKLDFEINLILYGTEAAGLLRNVIEDYRKYSTELRLDDWATRSPIYRVGQNTAKLLSPLL